MTRAWADRLLPSDARKLAEFFTTPPDLTDLVVRSVRFERRGPGCTLRVDLPGGVQCHLGFQAVDDVVLSGGTLPDIVTVELSPRPQARLAVLATGRAVRLSLTCAEQIRIGRFSTHNASAGEPDTGPHSFAGKVDQRLYTTVPDPEIDTYHEHF